MQTIDLMKQFVGLLRKHFDARQDILNCFSKHAIQVEGWLKGEILYFLDSEAADLLKCEFDREVNIGKGRRKVDFVLTRRNDGVLPQRIWMELKHWMIGYQKGTRWYASTYFIDASPVGIRPDVEKLINAPEGRKFLLILATVNPGENDWLSGVRRFNQKFKPFYVEGLTNPSEFPSSYFLGLLSSQLRSS